MEDRILYCLNLNLSMPFRGGSRSPVTCLFVTTVNNNFQPLPIFCHKELHLRCCIGLDHTFQPLRCPKWEVYNEPEEKTLNFSTPKSSENAFSEIFMHLKLV